MESQRRMARVVDLVGPMQLAAQILFRDTTKWNQKPLELAVAVVDCLQLPTVSHLPPSELIDALILRAQGVSPAWIAVPQRPPSLRLPPGLDKT